jgi:hypothetical protein
LTPEEKIIWAKEQRLEGNRLFGKQEFQEAMDVYLTCLVAIEYQPKADLAQEGSTAETTTEAKASSDTEPDHTTSLPAKTELEVHNENERRRAVEKEVQLPVLLNLAACAMKLGRYRKVEEFCNIALQDLKLTQCGHDNVKVWYRRGRARMFLGTYKEAKQDLQKALELATTATESKPIQKDLQKLSTLVQAGKSNERNYQKAMQKMFQGGPNNQKDSETGTCSSVSASKSDSMTTAQSMPSDGLYTDVIDGSVINTPQYSTLRASPKKSKRSKKRGSSSLSADSPDVLANIEELGIISWAFSIVTDCLRRVMGRWNSTEQESSSAESLNLKKSR